MSARDPFCSDSGRYVMDLMASIARATGRITLAADGRRVRMSFNA